MENFQVPQFIDQKAKIVGPLTLKQFGFLVAAGFVSLISYNIFNFFLWAVITMIVGVVATALAFIKINGKDLPNVAYSAFLYFWKPRVYVWQRNDAGSEIIDTSPIDRIEVIRKRMGLEEGLKSLMTLVTTSKNRTEAMIRGEQARGYQEVMDLTGETERARRVDYKG